MLRRTCQLLKTHSSHFPEAYNSFACAFVGCHVSKRYAGHSEWANRIGDRAKSAKIKSQSLEKFRMRLTAILRQTKNPNPETNSQLQGLISEAKQQNISSATIERYLKSWSNTDGDPNLYYFASPTGIASIVEMCGKPSTCQRDISTVLKKYGFKHVPHPYDLFHTTGVVTGKPIENCENAYEKAVEHAIEANFEEVNVNDEDNYEFLCDANQINICANKLTKLGYEIQCSTVNITFPEYQEVNDETILQNLQKMEEKLQEMNGYVRTVFNIK